MGDGVFPASSPVLKTRYSSRTFLVLAKHSHDGFLFIIREACLAIFVVGRGDDGTT
jgi:hypothetical protein